MARKFDYDAAYAALATAPAKEVAKQFGVSYRSIKRLHTLPRDENGKFFPAGTHRAHFNPNAEAVREAVELNLFTTGGWTVEAWALKAGISTGCVYRHLRKLGVQLPRTKRRGRAHVIPTDVAASALAIGTKPRDLSAQYPDASLSAVYAAFRRAKAAQTEQPASAVL